MTSNGKQLPFLWNWCFIRQWFVKFLLAQLPIVLYNATQFWHTVWSHYWCSGFGESSPGRTLLLTDTYWFHCWFEKNSFLGFYRSVIKTQIANLLTVTKKLTNFKAFKRIIKKIIICRKISLKEWRKYPAFYFTVFHYCCSLFSGFFQFLGKLN